MRPLALAACLAFTACGTTPPPSTASTATPAAVAVRPDNNLTLRDVGASKSGCSVVVPADHELQLAVVVIRDGAFSPTESTILRWGGNQERPEACSLTAFWAKGPLRPDATDSLVIVSGGPTLRAASPHGPTCSVPGEMVMGIGQPFLAMAQMTWGKPGEGYSNDPRQPEGVLLGVHLYARVVVIDASNQYHQELMRHRGASGYRYGAGEPLTSLDQVLPQRGAPPPGAF